MPRKKNDIEPPIASPSDNNAPAKSIHNEAKESNDEQLITTAHPQKPKQQRKKRKKKRKLSPIDKLKKVLKWLLFCFLILIFALLFGLFELWQKGWLPTPEELPKYKERLHIMFHGYYTSTLPQGDVIGIDISHYQGDIDWEELSFYVDRRGNLHRSSGKKRKARDVDFVIAKATQGANIKDSYYNDYKAGARQRDILFGAYHFYSAGVSATLQADNFIHTAGLQNGDIVPVLDVEPYKNQLPKQDSVYHWLQIIEKYYGVTPIIYTNEKCYLDYFAPQSRFRHYPFWIARYGGKEPSRHHIMWQCAENGKVAGITGPVDLNVFRGTFEDLKHKHTIK